MAEAKIATTLLETGSVDESLAVSDVYTDTAKTATNASESATSAVTTEQSKQLKTVGKGAAEALDGIADGLESDKTDATSSAAAALLSSTATRLKSSGLPQSTLDAIDPTLLSSVSAGLNASKSTASKLVMEDGSTITIPSSANVTSVTSLTKMLSKTLKNDNLSTIVDDSATLQTTIAALDLIVDLGVVDLLDKVLNAIGDSEDAKKKLISKLESAVRQGDIDTVNRIIDYIGETAALTRVPTFHRLLLKGYSFPSEMTTAKYTSERTRLVTLLNRVDPDWDKTEVNGVTTLYLTPFIGMSDDSATLLSGVEEYRTRVIMQDSYRIRDIMTIAEETYEVL